MLPPWCSEEVKQQTFSTLEKEPSTPEKSPLYLSSDTHNEGVVLLCWPHSKPLMAVIYLLVIPGLETRTSSGA